MEFKQARQKFIQSWGTLGSNWGINKTMAQIHALVLVSAKPLSTEEIMEELSISRGNANMNVRALLDWGLVEKEFVVGERKEFFVAEKDMWQIAVNITKMRRQKELAPVLKVLGQIDHVEGKGEEVEEFVKVMKELSAFVKDADRLFEKFSSNERSWYMNLIRKIF